MYQVFPDFYKFTRGTILVGHNIIGFDLIMLNANAQRVKYEFNKSRFIVEVVDVNKVNKEGIQKLGAQGIVEIDNQLKIILGDNAKQFKKYIDDLK